MNEKNRVFIFDKKELALIFIFMVLIAITSFSFGVKIGKGIALHSSGISHDDKNHVHEKVEMKSIEEEKMDSVTKSSATTVATTATSAATADKTYKKLEEEFEKINRISLDDKDLSKKIDNKASESVLAPPPPPPSHNFVAPVTNAAPSAVAPLKGATTVASASPATPALPKYTIQLGSYQLESDAVKYADGFKVRGYSPIISEVRIPEKGIWYRVSIGTFASISEAKEYITKEESLFQGQDYVIAEFN